MLQGEFNKSNKNLLHHFKLIIVEQFLTWLHCVFLITSGQQQTKPKPKQQPHTILQCTNIQCYFCYAVVLLGGIY